MGLEVIHHDDVVALERWDQALLDIGQEHLSRHRPVDHHRRGHFFVVPQGGHEGNRLPFAKRNTADQPHSPRSAPPEPRHIGADRSLVDKHQPGGVKHALLSDSSVGARGPRLLAVVPRLAGFFLKVTSCRPKNRESALRLVRIRRLSSSASVSFKVRSGRSAMSANIRSAYASNGETLPPRGFGAALRLSVQRCSHLTAELALTSKRSAASRRDAPSISTASITRSRRFTRIGLWHRPTPEKENQCAKTRSFTNLWESHRFNSVGTRFSAGEARKSQYTDGPRWSSATVTTPQYRANRYRAVALAPPQRPNLSINDGVAASPPAGAKTGRNANPCRGLGRGGGKQGSRKCQQS